MVVLKLVPSRRRQLAWMRRMLAATSLTLAGGGCLPTLPNLGHEAASTRGSSDGASLAADAGDAAHTPPCRPLLTGELLLNEIVVRPGGLDADGDGASTGRDEVVEVVSLAPVPAHALGVVLRIDGVVRGVVAQADCLAPGGAALLVGSTTADAGRVATLPSLRLDHTLRLRDAASRLELLSSAGGIHDGVSLPAATGMGPAVWTRAPDANPDSPWVAHSAVPPHRPWSLGACAGGGWLPVCAAPAAAPSLQ